jgi:preprotein translocase subunit SecG
VQPIIIFLMRFFLFVLPLFLILLILIQRGKGGGLAGAFGGLGGQSAFGTKAGDLFTRITIGVAAVWILLCVFSVGYFGFSATHGHIVILPSTADEDQPGNEPANSAPQSGSSEPSEPTAPAAPGE